MKHDQQACLVSDNQHEQISASKQHRIMIIQLPGCRRQNHVTSFQHKFFTNTSRSPRLPVKKFGTL